MPSTTPSLLLAAALLSACTTTAPAPAATAAATAPAFDLARLRLIDLSHPFNAKTIYWPNSPTSFALKSQANGKTPGGWYYRANSFSSPEHGGTHLDAPSHFAEQGYASDQIPLTQLVAPAVVIDISAAASQNADYLLTRDDVLAFEKTHGVIPAGSMVLLRTGWSSKWPDKKAYLGDDTPGRTDHLHFPSFSPQAATLLVDERKVAVLGADVASIDYGQSADFQVHRLAMAKNVAGLENLTNLDSLPPTGAFVVALPMKIEGGSGGPLRAIALVPR
ncbi:MAG: cyclase family protein [Gemmatimonadaceae bacterium]|nr:cyclase family protein [Gemmatimonadaceae bacterium]